LAEMPAVELGDLSLELRRRRQTGRGQPRVWSGRRHSRSLERLELPVTEPAPDVT